ncbi:MAG: DUF4132 domain-containing protein [Bacteroidia bacterium]
MGILNKLFNFSGKSNYDELIADSIAEVKKTNTYFYVASVKDLESYVKTISQFTDDVKIDFVLDCIHKIYTVKPPKNYYPDENRVIRQAYINQILKSKIQINFEQFDLIINGICTPKNCYEFDLSTFSVSAIISQAEKQFSDKNLPESTLKSFEILKNYISKNNVYTSDKDRLKLISKIDSIMFSNANADKIKPTYFMGQDDFTDFANNIIQQKKEDEKELWFLLIDKASKATGSKPSDKYLNDSKKIIDEMGSDKFKKTIHEWFQFIIDLKEKLTTQTHTYGTETYNIITSEFLSAINIETMKGFIWMCSHFYDNQTIQLLSKLAERCYKKIPQKGPAAAAIGNACLFSLYSSNGLDGIGQLSRLKLRIKQNNTQTIIEKYINSAAQKLGISTHEIEDLAVEDFGLINNERSYVIENFHCTIQITGVGKSTLRWFKADNTEQKTVPVIIKEKYAAKLKKIKDTQKQVDQTTSAQRDRIDRMLRSNRIMPLDYFIKNYFEHALLSFLSKKIIWNFIGENHSTSAIFKEEIWVDFDNKPLNINDFQNVSLWHPITAKTNEVKAWRTFLIENKIQQPLKQAFREIYILTDAEINTRNYSNRMAAHVLKQHQYVTLAKGRNWNAKLIGSWDGGDQDTAFLNLAEYNLRVEYWVNALNADDAYNETGIWNYITTDQIRFINTIENNVVDLIDIPPIAFSEALRDVDLFVGVASVGNDPTWQDSGGLPAYRDYWQSYSFGDLSETAKNRKEILSGLIPRLKIANVSSIIDKFLVVKGKLRTYKIHIGSTNILMEPNDQYLCIVADRSQKNLTENLFIPFEGDSGLSVILSKAFLLANDDKITDKTITSQINRS